MSRIRRSGGRLAAAFAAVLCSFLAAPADAQRDGPARDSASVIALGTPNAIACAQAAAAPTPAPNALTVCDAALAGERLQHFQRLSTLLNRGLVHLRLQQGEQALADFDAAAALDPDSGEAQLNRGAAFMLMDRPGPAVAALTEALSLGVREPHKAYFNRGQAREALGDQRGAVEDYSTALEIQPDWGPAEVELSRFVRERRDLLAESLREDPAP